MKKKLLVIFLVILGIGLIIFSILDFLDFFRLKGAGILVDTEPVSDVFINGENVGKTPYETTREANNVFVRLIPNGELPTYETKVKLEPGVKTIIKRDFDTNEQKTSGAIVSFEKIGGGDSVVSVVSVPENSQLFLDERASGFSPLKMKVVPGEHKLQISSVGYLDKLLSIRAYKGYKLTAVIKLAKDDSTQTTTEPVLSENTENFGRVKILDTDIGYLRVRKEPNSGSEILGQVNPGDTFDILEENPPSPSADGSGEASWYKIEFENLVFAEDGSGGVPTKLQGWVSGEFVKKMSN